MNIVNDLEQNSEKWLQWRRMHIGASDCPSILGRNPYSTPTDIYEQKVLGREVPYNAHMQRGHLLEPMARAILSEMHGRDYTPICATSKEREWQAASLDCYHKSGEEIFCGEIKAPRLKKILEIQKYGVPDYWEWQMQHQMSVMGVDKMFFFAYSPEEQFYEEVMRKQYMIDLLNEIEEKFYFDYLWSFRPPENEYFEYLAQKIG